MAGIVIGVVAGVLLILWAINQRSSMGKTEVTKNTVYRSDDSGRRRRRRGRSYSDNGGSRSTRVRKPERVYYTEK